MKLREGDKVNFQTLANAFENGDVALVDVRRKSDGKSVAVICCVERDGEEYTIIPFATMVEGNPFELFDPPSVEEATGYART